jgi:hypothetical protein
VLTPDIAAQPAAPAHSGNGSGLAWPARLENYRRVMGTDAYLRSTAAIPVADVMCDHWAVRDNGVLVLSYRAGPDYAPHCYVPHSVYAPAAWRSLVHDEPAENDWRETRVRESERWHREREEQPRREEQEQLSRIAETGPRH